MVRQRQGDCDDPGLQSKFPISGPAEKGRKGEKERRKGGPEIEKDREIELGERKRYRDIEGQGDRKRQGQREREREKQRQDVFVWILNILKGLYAVC